jgi:hypothetical protein
MAEPTVTGVPPGAKAHGLYPDVQERDEALQTAGL